MSSQSCYPQIDLSMEDQEKIMLNILKSWFLALEFPKGVTQFYGILRDKEFPRVQ